MITIVFYYHESWTEHIATITTSIRFLSNLIEFPLECEFELNTSFDQSTDPLFELSKWKRNEQITYPIFLLLPSTIPVRPNLMGQGFVKAFHLKWFNVAWAKINEYPIKTVLHELGHLLGASHGGTTMSTKAISPKWHEKDIMEMKSYIKAYL